MVGIPSVVEGTGGMTVLAGVCAPTSATPLNAERKSLVYILEIDFMNERWQRSKLGDSVTVRRTRVRFDL